MPVQDIIKLHEYNYRIFHLHSAKDRNSIAKEKTHVVDRAIPLFLIPWRITMLFHFGTRTRVRRMEYSVNRDHLWRYRRSRFKKTDGLPSYMSFLSKHARCRNRQQSGILRSCRPHEPPSVTFQKAAGYTSLSSSLENTSFYSLYLDSILDLLFSNTRVFSYYKIVIFTIL